MNETTDPGARPVPARMLNELVYCPRLFYFEWVQGEFADNHFTVEGQAVHRRVDRPDPGGLPAELPERPFEVRSVTLSSQALGITGKIDLVEVEDGKVCPVDYKRGKPAPTPEQAWEPERVQLCAYGLLLREHGFSCDEGVLYFAKTKTRVTVRFDDALIARTLETVQAALVLASQSQVPAPLRNSPKCGSCSLNALCLPDEVNLLNGETARAPRRLVAENDDAQAFYVQGQGLRVGLDGEQLVVRDPDRLKVGEARLEHTSHVVLMGNIQMSAQALHAAFGKEISVCWMTYGGWFHGISEGLGHKNVDIRRAQYRWADDPARSLRLARRFIRCKVANARTMLRRNGEPTQRVLDALADAVERCDGAESLPQLLGLEGNAAREYFGAFSGMLRPPPLDDRPWTFDFALRNRRPPADPVNALLSFAYAMLTKELTLAARRVGLDPYLGFLHQPRHGKPALALDLMEEFRPLVADSAVLTAINTGAVRPADFKLSAMGVALSPDGRRSFLKVLERRLNEEVTHPVFGYRVSYRRVFEVQCRLLARHLGGEIDEYPEFRTR